MFDLEQPKIEDLLAVLPKPVIQENEFGGWIDPESAQKAVPELRTVANNCPACIMAAIRQKGFPVRAIISFNFTEECKQWWADWNVRQVR